MVVGPGVGEGEGWEGRWPMARWEEAFGKAGGGWVIYGGKMVCMMLSNMQNDIGDTLEDVWK